MTTQADIKLVIDELNELEPSTVMGIDNVCGRKTYRLPEGVTK